MFAPGNVVRSVASWRGSVVRRKDQSAGEACCCTGPDASSMKDNCWQGIAKPTANEPRTKRGLVGPAGIPAQPAREKPPATRAEWQHVVARGNPNMDAFGSCGDRFKFKPELRCVMLICHSVSMCAYSACVSVWSPLSRLYRSTAEYTCASSPILAACKRCMYLWVSCQASLKV